MFDKKKHPEFAEVTRKVELLHDCCGTCVHACEVDNAENGVGVVCNIHDIWVPPTWNHEHEEYQWIPTELTLYSYICDDFEWGEDSRKWYSSHGKPVYMPGFIEIEVYDRENYTLDDIRKWIRKYGLHAYSKIIWVADSPWKTVGYEAGAEYLGNEEKSREYMKETGFFPVKFVELYDGIIVKESYDGDGGFLMILKES